MGMGIAMGILIGNIMTNAVAPVEIGESENFVSGSEEAMRRVEMRRLAGMTDEIGPGIKITLEDARYRKRSDIPIERLIIHERDLLLMRNELFAAGAVAMAINGERIVATTEIRCVGPVIRINGRSTVPPYVIEAAGEPDVLKQSVLMMGGVADFLSSEDLKVDVEIIDELLIPALGKFKKVEPSGAVNMENHK